MLFLVYLLLFNHEIIKSRNFVTYLMVPIDAVNDQNHFHRVI